MKLLIILITMTAWLPWTNGAKKELGKTRMILHEVVDCPSWRGSYDPGKQIIHLCKRTSRDARVMVLLHESQHHFAFQYEMPHNVNWEKFQRLGLNCVKGHSRKAWMGASKFASLNPMELHAQLPWLVHGKMCPKLQPYYPWFDLRNP